MKEVPEYFKDQPGLVEAVISARKIQMEDGDGKAIQWLRKNHCMSKYSAERAITNKTFRYLALYPEGHPYGEEIQFQIKFLEVGKNLALFPDFVYFRTGLSVKDRTWEEAGCITPFICKNKMKCDNGEYVEERKGTDEFFRDTYMRTKGADLANDLEDEKKRTKDPVRLKYINKMLERLRDEDYDIESWPDELKKLLISDLEK